MARGRGAEPQVWASNVTGASTSKARRTQAAFCAAPDLTFASTHATLQAAIGLGNELASGRRRRAAAAAVVAARAQGKGKHEEPEHDMHKMLNVDADPMATNPGDLGGWLLYTPQVPAHVTDATSQFLHAAAATLQH